MKTVNKNLVKEWMWQKGRRGFAHLMLKADISESMLNKVLCGEVPKKGYTRLSIAQAIGVDESEVFPDVDAEVIENDNAKIKKTS